MTPKEKAQELVSLFTKFSLPDDEDGKWESWYLKRKKNAKECALIAVDEIMYNNLMEYPQHSTIYAPHKNDYWQDVKQEIEKL
jgi:hypothetical protein